MEKIRQPEFLQNLTRETVNNLKRLNKRKGNNFPKMVNE